MKNYSHKTIRGRKFSQDSLVADFQQLVVGQAIFFRLIAIFLALVLVIISGCLAGFLGAFIGLNITAHCEDKVAFFIMYSGVIITVVTWIVEALRKGLSQSFVRVSLEAILLLPILAAAAAFLGQNTIDSLGFIGNFLFLTLIAVTVAFISLLTGSLCKYLITVLSDSVKEIITKLYFCTLIGLSILFSWLFASTLFPENRCLPGAIAFWSVPIISGAVCGIGITSASILATQSQYHPPERLTFLRTWAIAIGSWGGTSFYNLDLSGVNFQAAQLANSDFRAKKLYRTCLQNVTGLERARVNNQYLDLANPNVQKLLIHGICETENFSQLNLQGAYLQNVNVRGGNFTDTYLTGADFQRADLRDSVWVRAQAAGVDFQRADIRYAELTDANLTKASFRGADLRGAVLVRAQMADVDFTGADLTGICIEDWSVNEHTIFTDVRCDYIFRKYQDSHPVNRYPINRSFEVGEFSALFQKLKNEIELVFKGEFSYSALSLAFYKLQTERGDLHLSLYGIEQRGELWIVKITSDNLEAGDHLEQQLSEVYEVAVQSDSLEQTIKDSIYRDYEATKQRLAESQQLVHQLAGISETQAHALEHLSQQPFGTNFFISGSTISNLASQGNIEYAEAANQVRNLVTTGQNTSQLTRNLRQFRHQLTSLNVATTEDTQTELIQQVMLAEADKDKVFKQYLLQQGDEICQAIGNNLIAQAIQSVIAQLTSDQA